MISELSLMVNWNCPSITIDSTWKVHRATSPPMPDWLYLRPNLSMNSESTLPMVGNFLIKSDERRTLGSYTLQA